MFFRLAVSLARTGKLTRSILLCMGLLDELLTGFTFIALPLLRERFHLSYAQAGFLFTAASLASMVFDPLMNLFSDRTSKKPWILSGLFLLALTSLLMGSIDNYALLLLIFLLWYPANSTGVELAQAALIDFSPESGARTMTRWTLVSGIGDFLSPLVVAAFVAAGLGWSALCWFSCAIWLFAALLLFPLRFPARAAQLEEEEAEQTSVWAGLREALRDPLLLRWAVLALIPNMLDEIFLGFVALYLHDVLHFGETGVALLAGVQMVGSFLGLFVLDRWLKYHKLVPVRTLFWLSLATLLGMAGLLLFHALWFTIGALLIISFSCAGWYPLAQAEAYARFPTRSGVVRVVIGLGAPLEMILPGIIGLISAKFGVLAGLVVPGLAPVFMLLLLPYGQARRDREAQSSSAERS
jgi:MFS family permease